MYHIPFVVNDIARALGHAFSVGPDEAMWCGTLQSWHEAASAAFERRLDEIEAHAREFGVRPVSPAAIWDFIDDKDLPYVEHWTLSRRLHIVADDGWLGLTIYAGPKDETIPEALTFVRGSDGRYDLDIVGGIYPPEALVVDIRSGTPVIMSPIKRIGREVMSVEVYREGKIVVEWMDPDLAIEKPSRVDLIWRFDDLVFEGAIERADTT
ncbi:MAG: hypothetical protein C4321_05775, partial [Chloroflexota bacterium]